MPLRDFLMILRVRWRTIVASMLLVLGAAVATTLTTTPSYTASTRVFLSTQNGGHIVAAKDLDAYVAVLGSPEVLESLRVELGLVPGAPVDVSANVLGSSSMLDITANASDPRLAAAIANAVGPQLAKLTTGKFSPMLAYPGLAIRATEVTPASVPGSPASPNVIRNVLLGLMTGLVMGVGLAFIGYSLDTKVRDESDVKALSDRPMVGNIPFIKAVRQQPLAMEADPHGAYAEAVRRLRTNLLFVSVTTGRQSFVITSAVPGEGKTTTAINLAKAMADAGARVLLVDADLRKPSVAGMMGLEGSVGLMTILLGRATIEDVAQQWKDSSLYVMPAGQIPPNPSELLGSAAMEKLFGQLTERFDFVLVDSPPMVPVVDAVQIKRLTGGLLMVVGVDQTRKHDLSSALKSLETVNEQVSGFVLNLVPGAASDSYRNGYRRYGSASADGTQPSKKSEADPVVPLARAKHTAPLGG